jgi:hypothetical protein
MDRDALSTVLVLPKLTDLSLDVPLNDLFLTEFMAGHEPGEILPRAAKLEIKFWDARSSRLV